MNSIRSIYDIYDWRDPICVSHYPLPDQPVDDSLARKYLDLEKRSDTKTKAIYVHVPFCESICSFCPFNKVLKREDKVEAYIKAIKREIEIYSKSPYFSSSYFEAVNFGGGTPSCLSPAQISEIVTYLRSHFQLTADAVVSMEGSVATFTAEKMRAAYEAGINRISIGIQSFNNNLRTIMGLEEDRAFCQQLLDTARGIGYQNIGIDLMYNLPGQTMQDWHQDVKYAISQDIDHITLFALCMVPGTKLQKQIIRGEVPNVGHQNDEVDMFIEGRRLLLDAGYIQYSIWDFAKPGKIDRNPLLYYNYQRDLLGMGPAAFGYVNQFMYINKGRVDDYADSLNRSEVPVLVGKKADEMDQMRGMMSKGLRNCYVDKRLFYELFKQNPEEMFASEVRELLNQDLISIDDERITLTERGNVWGNNVSKVFFESPETFEWRSSLAKGRIPKPQDKDGSGDFHYETLEWEENLQVIFERMLERKPAFIRDKARKDILNLIVSSMKSDNRNVVSEKDVVYATLMDTPGPFRNTAINGFRNLGVDMDKYDFLSDGEDEKEEL